MRSAGARLLVRHLTPRRWSLLRLLGWTVVQGVPTFGSGILIARAIDRGFLTGQTLVGLGWLGVYAAIGVAGALATRALYPWLADVVEPVRDSLVTDVVAGSLEQGQTGERSTGGASVAQATQQVETVRQLLSSLLTSAQEFATSIIGAVAGLAVLSALLALVVAPFVLVALALFVVFLKVLLARQRAVLLAGEQVSELATPAVTGVRDVVACAAEEHAAAPVLAAIDAQAATQRAFAWARVSRLAVVALGGQVPLVVVLAVAPWLVGRHGTTAGTIAGAAIYLANGLEPAFRYLVNAAGASLVNLGAVTERLAEVCAPARRGTVSWSTAGGGRRPAGHALDVDDLTFGYSPTAEPVIRDLDLHVPEQAHLAIVGPSGVGKSTLASLLAGLTFPHRGQVRLGGVPLIEVAPAALRRTFALIPQEAYVFAGSLRENLTYLAPEATTAELESAMAEVGLTPVAERLGGLDGLIPPGGGALSSGERQLVALTRVFLSPAGLVILDEASCHLDPVAEERAELAFAARPGTLIVIAHRVSSAIRADQVLVLDGVTASTGTHETLLDRGGLYADLVGHWNGMSAVPAEVVAG